MASVNYIYFIEAKGLNKIKIGRTNNIPRRMRDLQTGSPVKLILIKSIKGSRKVESEFHKKFSHLKVFNEWFDFKGDLRKFLRAS